MDDWSPVAMLASIVAVVAVFGVLIFAGEIAAAVRRWWRR